MIECRLRVVALAMGLLSAVAIVGVADARAQEGEGADAPAGCTSAGHAEFDFWIGEWNLTWEGGSGTNRIERTLDGCVIHESFSGDMPTGTFVGESFSVYNPNSEGWRQTWVDNTGNYLPFEGGMEEDRLVLRGKGSQPGVLTRMTFYNIEDDSLDWDWETSNDGGETWNLAWRIHYARQ